MKCLTCVSISVPRSLTDNPAREVAPPRPGVGLKPPASAHTGAPAPHSGQPSAKSELGASVLSANGIETTKDIQFE